MFGRLISRTFRSRVACITLLSPGPGQLLDGCLMAGQPADDRLLYRGGPGGPGQLWQSEHLQHRPSLSVHRQEFMGLLKDHSIQISMDGTDCRRDNVFVERLWRTIK